MAANVMFHQLGRRRADRVFRERFSIDHMCDEEIRRRYRFSKESIKQIVDMIDPIIGPKTKRSQALSTELQVHHWPKKTYFAKSLCIYCLSMGSVKQQQGLAPICLTWLRHICRHFGGTADTEEHWFNLSHKKWISAFFFQIFLLVFINWHFDFVYTLILFTKKSDTELLELSTFV